MHGSLKIAVLACGLVVWPASAYAQTLKLSSTPLPAGADVLDFQLSRDGALVVYRGDLETDGVIDLFSTSTSGGGAQLKLNGGALLDGDVFSDYHLNADGSRVVYRGDLVIEDVADLYSASTVASGTQIRLSFTSTAGGDVFPGYQLTGDGNRVVYRGDLVTNSVSELYSASTVASGTQVVLSSTSLPGADVFSDYQISFPGLVTYRGDLTVDGVSSLYGAYSTVGGSQIGLSFSTLVRADVFDYQLTPEGNRAVYRGDLATDGRTSLYSAATFVSGSQIGLSFTTLAGADVSDYQLTPDGSRVVYRGDLVTDGSLALYSSSTFFGGTQIPLSSTTLAGADVFDYQITPDGSHVVYRGDLVADGVSALYSVSTTASGTQLDLSSATLARANVSADYKLLPDSSRVVYRGALSQENVVELYSASTTASGAQIGLSSTSLAEAAVFDFQLTPDGNHAIYRGDLSTSNLVELYSAATDAVGTQVKLNNSLSAVDDWIGNIQISDDGQSLAFMVGTTTDPLDETKFTGKELFWTPITGGGATSVAIANTEITSYQFNGDTLIFAGDLDTPGMTELYHFVWFSGNYDEDRDVDGADFLKWQRGESPTPLSQSDLAAWQGDFGSTPSPTTIALQAVPEPSCWMMLWLAAFTCSWQRRWVSPLSTDRR